MPPYPSSQPGDENDPTWRSVKLVYILHLIGAFTALPIFIGALISHLKLNQGSPSAQSHTSYQVRTFWYYVLFNIIGYATIIFLGLGFLVLFIGWIWFIYRMVMGLKDSLDSDPITA